MNVPEVAARIDSELRALGSPTRAEHEKRYLKSELEHYGASVPEIRAVAKSAYADLSTVTHDELLALVESLWSQPVHERRMASVEILGFGSASLQPTDAALLELLIREAKTWALVDGLAASVVGPLVERFPELRTTLDRWASDSDFWVRRSALLALLPSLRRGAGDFERFARYADAMLEEREFFIRKAIGWVLRETGKKRPELVFAWLLPRAQRASGITVREAVKYLSDKQRAEILAAAGSTKMRKTHTREQGTP